MPTPVLSSEGGDAFPEFNDGNVIVVIAPGNHLRLHVDHLKRSAERFKKLFAEDFSKTSQSEAIYGALPKNISANYGAPAAPPPRKKNKKAANTIHYLALQGADERDIAASPGVLIPTVSVATTRSPILVHRVTRAAQTKDAIERDGSFFGGNLNAKVEQRYVRLWRNVLGSLYNAHMKLDQADLTTLLKDSVGMIGIATYLGCIPVLSYRIEHALVGQGDALWRSILNNPVAWIDLAWKLGAKDIYKEALIHLAGTFHCLTADQKRSIPAEVYPKVEGKAQLLEKFKGSVDFRLATWICPDLKPRHMTPGAKSGQDHGRTAYADNIYVWIGQHLFDHFLKFAFQNGDNRGASDGGFSFYYCIYLGGDAYLRKTDLDRFHNGDCPMTPKGQRVLFNAVQDIKVQAKELVRPLFTNSARIDRERERLTHFTCVPVTEEDLEWLQHAKDMKAVGGRAENGAEDDDDEMGEEGGVMVHKTREAPAW